MLYPCLWYDNNAKEAAEYYCSIFENSKITLDSPLVVHFEIDGQRIMGLNGGSNFVFNPSISLFVTFDNEEKMVNIYDKLLEGGSAMMPMGAYPWAEKYAWITDKYGLSWQLMRTENPCDKKISPCFLFVNQVYQRGEEAINLYRKIFTQSELYSLSHYDDDPLPKGMLKHVHFSIADFPMRAMDGSNEHKFEFNEAISIVVECQNQNEIDHYWDSLISDGGQESMCGWLKDKFGISWQIIPYNIGSMIMSPSNGQRAMQALLKMKKIDIISLENA